MGKLGKKARKFAKKNLQSVHKRNRKLNSTFKRKHSSSKGNRGESTEDQVGTPAVLSNGRHSEDAIIEDLSLVPVFSEDDSDSLEDGSASDGSLSEDSSCAYVSGSEIEKDSVSSERSGRSAVFEQNQGIHVELEEQKGKLDGLMKKIISNTTISRPDPVKSYPAAKESGGLSGKPLFDLSTNILKEMYILTRDAEFAKFLDGCKNDKNQFIDEQTYSDGEDETSDQDMITAKEHSPNVNKKKILTINAIDSWCELIMAQKLSPFPSLLNAYRAACHYGSDDGINTVSCQRFHSSGTFCKIVMFMLKEADGIFRRALGISSSTCKKETVLELKNTSKWKNSEPFIKSYLRSTLFLLSQISDSEILVFALIRLRASIIFFAAFPGLQRRLIKVSIHLWATGRDAVSSSSFLIVRDIALLLSPDCHDACLIKTYKSFIAHCMIVESSNLKHLQFLLESLVELYSLDIPKSYGKVFTSLQQLARILQLGLKTKKKEALKKIYNWQYTNCIDLWVKFISSNIKDHDLQPLLYLIVQVINGVAHLFPGARYFPLRLKCIQMLNQLSSSSGIFIPITSLVLDSLEYVGSGKPDTRPKKVFDVSSVLKVPKQWLKLQSFQERLVISVIELFSVHFSQWSLHVSFPELATFPLIRLKTFHEKITTESLRRHVKRLIDQVEQNVEFVQKKRDDVAFSPKDQESVESFLQLETCKKAPFTQYYASVIEKSLSGEFQKTSTIKRKASRNQQHQNHEKRITQTESDKDVDSVIEGKRRKKQRT